MCKSLIYAAIAKGLSTKPYRTKVQGEKKAFHSFEIVKVRSDLIVLILNQIMYRIRQFKLNLQYASWDLCFNLVILNKKALSNLCLFVV